MGHFVSARPILRFFDAVTIPSALATPSKDCCTDARLTILSLYDRYIPAQITLFLLLYRYNSDMSKSSRAREALPSTLPTLLAELGAGIAIARKRRRITMKQMAQRMRVSLDTVQRLEKGDSGVSIGIVATALWVLGLQDRLQELTDPTRDHVALAQDLQRLPKAVHAPKQNPEEFDF